jgi:hypothetical protein
MRPTNKNVARAATTMNVMGDISRIPYLTSKRATALPCAADFPAPSGCYDANSEGSI